MKILTEGHKYELENHEHPINVPNQTLQFIEKQPAPEMFPSGSLITVNECTTNEDILAVLIDRMNYLQNKFSCRENAIVLTHLETALLWLGKRTADRKARKVEGMNLK
jgi:hypothetical protein